MTQRERLTKALARVLPMRCLERCRFVDVVSGRSVGLYREISGRLVLADSPWSLFRVAREDGST